MTLIGLMHARTEAADVEAADIDEARAKDGSPSAGLSVLFDNRMAERNLLADAILRQQPTCPEDAAILAHHAHNASDLLANWSGDEGHRKALTDGLNQAIQSLFCYLVDAAPIEPESVGPLFAQDVELARMGQRVAPAAGGC